MCKTSMHSITLLHCCECAPSCISLCCLHMRDAASALLCQIFPARLHCAACRSHGECCHLCCVLVSRKNMCLTGLSCAVCSATQARAPSSAQCWSTSLRTCWQHAPPGAALAAAFTGAATVRASLAPPADGPSLSTCSAHPGWCGHCCDLPTAGAGTPQAQRACHCCNNASFQALSVYQHVAWPLLLLPAAAAHFTMASTLTALQAHTMGPPPALAAPCTAPLPPTAPCLRPSLAPSPSSVSAAPSLLQTRVPCPAPLAPRLDPS